MTEAITWSLSGDNAIHILDAVEAALDGSASILVDETRATFELVFPLDQTDIDHFTNILKVISLVLTEYLVRDRTTSKGRFSDLTVAINNSGQLVVTLTR